MSQKYSKCGQHLNHLVFSSGAYFVGKVGQVHFKTAWTIDQMVRSGSGMLYTGSSELYTKSGMLYAGSGMLYSGSGMLYTGSGILFRR